MDVDRYRGKSNDDLLSDIEESWSRLMATMTSHTEADYGTKRDPAGWTALDHMAHVTAWERSVLFPMRGRPRHEGLGVTAEEFHSVEEPAMNFNPLNEIVRAQTSGDSYETVMTDANKGHDKIVEAITSADIDDLWKPTTELCPDQREEGKSRPFMLILMSDTAEHYDEHRGYIEKILAT
jgi:hypothetical protein